MGKISHKDVTEIQWSKLPAHPGHAHYRVAAGPSEKDNRIYFSGGAANPYNFDGMGYDGHPSEPSPVTFAFNYPNRKMGDGEREHAAADDGSSWIDGHTGRVGDPGWNGKGTAGDGQGASDSLEVSYAVQIRTSHAKGGTAGGIPRVLSSNARTLG
jgi:hypothetical protein